MKWTLVAWAVVLATLTGSPSTPVDRDQTYGPAGCALHLPGIESCQGL